MSGLIELLLLDALASAAREREEEEDRPENFFVLPPNNDGVWREAFKKCKEDNMVVGVEFTQAGERVIRAAILRLARQLYGQAAIFLRASIGDAGCTHDQLRRELGEVQYTPTFLLVSFLEGRREIRRYEGTLEIRNAIESGELRRDFEQCLERRGASGFQFREHERKGGEEQQQKEVEEARRAAIEERRRKRPEYVAQLLAMDLNKAPIKDIKDVMRKLELNPAGLLERGDLIAELKSGVTELRMKLDNPSSTPVGTTHQQPSMPLPQNEDFSNMDHDLLQNVASRIRNLNLQTAELHELKSLLAQAKLTVKSYPDRNSMVQALKRVVDTAQKTRNKSQSADNMTEIEHRVAKAEAKVTELQKQLRDTRILFASTKLDFDFISLLDQSEEGVVVKARCTRDEVTDVNKIYALKILTNYYQETSTVTTVREEFRNEYEILSQLLPHPNIIQLLAFFYDRMDPHLVSGIKNQTRAISLFMVLDYHTLDMEESIKELVEHQGPKSTSVLKWFTQLLSALAYLESCHIVHCDLKLKNILLSSEDDLKLCDFGSAIKLSADMTRTYLRGMKIPGNRPHQSPELRSPPRANHVINFSRADVWAAGVLAFEMCGHANPFETLDALGYTENQLPQLMYTRCKGSLQAFPLPSGLTTLVNSLLMYDWNKRPTAEDALSSARALTC